MQISSRWRPREHFPAGRLRYIRLSTEANVHFLIPCLMFCLSIGSVQFCEWNAVSPFQDSCFPLQIQMWIPSKAVDFTSWRRTKARESNKKDWFRHKKIAWSGLEFNSIPMFWWIGTPFSGQRALGALSDLQRFRAAFNHCVSVVVVDAFEVFSLDPVPGDVAVSLEF